MTVTLIGMPACGKSSMGRALASKLKMKNIDGDRLIESRCGKKLHEIIEDVGVEGFKTIEEEVLLSMKEDNVIFSPGGSCVYYDRAMKHLKSLGPVVYLYVSYDRIVMRLGDYSKRGIAIKDGQTLRDLYDERCALYKKYADVVVNCDGQEYALYQSEIVKIISDRKI